MTNSVLIVRKLRYLLPLVVAVSWAAPALADADFEQWFGASARTEIGNSVAAQAEIVARFGDAGGGLYEIENVLLRGQVMSTIRLLATVISSAWNTVRANRSPPIISPRLALQRSARECAWNSGGAMAVTGRVGACGPFSKPLSRWGEQARHC